MKNFFNKGDKKHFVKTVTADDFAVFNGEVVHPVCSTFALAREMEWTTRLFVLELRDDDEEGIGTFVQVNHHKPAFAGEEIFFEGTIAEINGNELICSVTAHVGSRLVATGKTGQKVMKREKIKQVMVKT